MKKLREDLIDSILFCRLTVGKIREIKNPINTWLMTGGGLKLSVNTIHGLAALGVKQMG